MIHDLVQQTGVLANPPHGRPLVITSIGDGPGSGLLGIAKLAGPLFAHNIIYNAVDAQPEWQRPFERVRQLADPTNRFAVHHHVFDFAAQAAVPAETPWLRADLFIISYVVSEILSRNGHGMQALRSMMTQAPSGARFVFADNRNERFYRPFLEECTREQIVPLYLRNEENEVYTIGHCGEENASELIQYRAILVHPETTADATRFAGYKL